MDENAGLGRVVWKDSLLAKGCWQLAAANKHANGRDWWILIGSNNSDQFYRFLVGPKGIQGPWVQNIVNPTRDPYYFNGWTNFSPDGKHYLLNHERIGFTLYDFDRCSGLLSNPRFVEPPYKIKVEGSYGAAFSPDSRFVYVATEEGQQVWQYDLTAPDLKMSGMSVATWDGFKDTGQWASLFGRFFPGPDGRIYMSSGVPEYWHTIEFPTRRGSPCRVKQRSLYFFGSSHNGHNFYYPNYRLGPLDGSACDTLGLDNHPEALFRYDLEDTLQARRLTFTDLSYYEPSEWHWDFGDPASGAANVSRDTNPVHTFSAPGLYTVCLIVKNQYAADTFCRQVSVGLTDAIEYLPAIPRITVAPNPFSASFRVLLPAVVSGARGRFALYDALGRRLREQPIHELETEIPAADLPPGAYYWTFSPNERVVQRGICVKME